MSRVACARALGAGWTAVRLARGEPPALRGARARAAHGRAHHHAHHVVAALNITTTLALVVVERRADIAVLSRSARARASVTLVFVIEGAIVGAVGALAGVALGLAACFVADRFNLVRLPRTSTR
jgi:hypothetical protein